MYSLFSKLSFLTFLETHGVKEMNGFEGIETAVNYLCKNGTYHLQILPNGPRELIFSYFIVEKRNFYHSFLQLLCSKLGLLYHWTKFYESSSKENDYSLTIFDCKFIVYIQYQSTSFARNEWGRVQDWLLRYLTRSKKKKPNTTSWTVVE